MHLTIIRETNTVAVDGVAFEVDCSGMPADVHAVQWDGERGEIEYSVTRCTHCGARTKKGNETISDAAPYQALIDAWGIAKTAHEAEVARLRAEAEEKAAANAPGPEG